MKYNLLFISALFLSCIALSHSTLADPIYVASKWIPLADSIEELTPEDFSEDGQYRLKFTNYYGDSDVTFTVLVSEVARDGGFNALRVTSNALTLNDVPNIGNSQQDNESIGNLLHSGSALDFRYRLEWLGDGWPSNFYLMSIIPGRPGAFGTWSIPTENVVIEELRSAYPQIIQRERVRPSYRATEQSKIPSREKHR